MYPILDLFAVGFIALLFGIAVGRSSTRQDRVDSWSVDELIREIVRRRHRERIEKQIREAVHTEVTRDIARGEQNWRV